MRFLFLAFFLVFLGCAPTIRFPLDVSRAVNRDDMRVLRSENVDLYYPAELQREAQAFLERSEGCLAALRARAVGQGGLSQRRVELILPDLPFNNAYVHPPFNGDFFSVVPTHWSSDPLIENGLPSGPGYVGCHELAHYVQAQQTLRSFGVLNKAFGYFGTPQNGLDSWFWEGLAVYYEGALQPGTGRLDWPVFNGVFDAAVAGRGANGGNLSYLDRKLPWGHAYVYGSHFIQFLVQRYGELRLWQLVERQGKSFFYPFIVNQRFRRVYGKNLSSLIDEWSDWLEETVPVRTRPKDQRVVRELGMNGRYARAVDGSEAVISEAMDDPPRLTVYGPDGRERFSKLLFDVLPERRLITPDASWITGLSFTHDVRKLYFVAVDRGPVFLRARLLEVDLQRESMRVVESDLHGFGGDVSPDGRSYLFVRTNGHGHALARYELATGEVVELVPPRPRVFYSTPRWSPDGASIVSTVFDGAFGIRLYAADGRPLQSLGVPTGPVHDPSFVDARRLLFLGSERGRFQIYVYDLDAQRATRLTDAPYLAMHPRAQGGTVRFFNRERFHFTLDEVPLPLPLRAHSFLVRSLADQDAAVPAPESSEGELIDFTPSAVPLAPAAAPAPAPAPAAPEPTPPDAGDLPVLRDQALSLPPPATLPAPSTDEDYAVFPRLLIPSLRVPTFVLPDTADAGFVGLYLGGTDALGKHRWGTTFGVQPGSALLSGAVGYINTQLSPLLLGVRASQLGSRGGAVSDRRDRDGYYLDSDRKQRDLTVSAALQLRTTLLELSLHGTSDQQSHPLARVYEERAMAGGTLGVAHDALERTPMTGPRRGYQASLRASYFPEPLTTLHTDVVDLRGQLTLLSPLPLSRRHTLRLDLIARGVLHGEPQPLLQVGGLTPTVLYDEPFERAFYDYPGLPPKRRFQEALRGFETLPFAVDQIGIAELSYRYPWIIDRGTATSLWILPSFFLRQIDLELFASVATSDPRRISTRGHAAAGGALKARLVWLGAFVLGYQLSRRLTDDERLQHLVTLGADLQ